MGTLYEKISKIQEGKSRVKPVNPFTQNPASIKLTSTTAFSTPAIGNIKPDAISLPKPVQIEQPKQTFADQRDIVEYDRSRGVTLSQGTVDTVQEQRQGLSKIPLIGKFLTGTGPQGPSESLYEPGSMQQNLVEKGIVGFLLEGFQKRINPTRAEVGDEIFTRYEKLADVEPDPNRRLDLAVQDVINKSVTGHKGKPKNIQELKSPDITLSEKEKDALFWTNTIEDAFAVLDAPIFVGSTKIPKDALLKFLKTTDKIDEIVPRLRMIGVGEDVAKDVAPKIAKSTNEIQIAKIIEDAKTMATEGTEPSLFSRIQEKVSKESRVASKIEPQQALDTTVVERADKVTENAPERFFRSIQGGKNFEEIASDDVVPAFIREDLDTFVTKVGDEYHVVEGKTGQQIGDGGRTVAEAVQKAKTEVQTLGDARLNEFVNNAPLSPRYTQLVEKAPVQAVKTMPAELPKGVTTADKLPVKTKNLVTEVNAKPDTSFISPRGTKDLDQLLRMLDREQQSLKAAQENPKAHAKAYGPGKAEEYKKNIKKLIRRIEYDVDTKLETAGTDISKRPPQSKPLEHKLDQAIMEREFLTDALANNPARQLARFANRNGDLPEVLGGEGGKFKKTGDDIANELGFEDSETARAAYQEYRLQAKRLETLKRNVRILREAQREMIVDEKDVKSLRRFLDSSARKTEKEIATANKRPSVIETPEMLAERKRVATLRQNRLLKALTETEPALERETLQRLGEQIENSQPLTLQEFEQMNYASLPKTVIDTNTPVKDKINIIDYFRTPDRVLKKLGLAKTAEKMRHAYETYLAELPAHIDFITDWSKRVPGEDSNRRIFRFLDGQRKIVNFDAKGDLMYLSEKELKVAKEIRAYLKDWADRLGLPEDQKISHYITHIFDVGEIEKEFDEDVAKIIKDKVPGSVYDPFLEKRLGRKGYIEDTWQALDAYAKRATRKANMDPILEKLKDAAERMEESQATYIKRFADRINMRPSETDTLIDNFIKSIAGYRFGQRPVASLTRTARQLVYRSMLGLNVGSALRNLTQGVNTFAKLGLRDTITGYTQLITRVNSKELEEVGILRQDFVQDRTLNATRKTLERVDKALFVLFDAAEKINRGAAYYGAKNQALRKGMNEMEAIKYAKKVVRDTQFQFGSIDTPVALNSDLAKVFSQFMTFAVKQTEFASEAISAREYKAITRYIAGALFMTYVVGEAFDVKGTDFIPGYSFTKYGTPPTLALPLSVIKAITDAPDRYGHSMDMKDKAIDIFSNIPFPASIQIKKILRDPSTAFGQPKEEKGKKKKNSNLPELPDLPALPKLPELPKLPKL